MSRITFETLQPFFCAAPYNTMMLVHTEWFDQNAVQREQPVHVSMRYRLDVRDLPDKLADIIGKTPFIRTYARSFQLQADGIEAHRKDQQANGDFYSDYRHFPLNYRDSARLMQDIAFLDRESLSSELWAIAAKYFIPQPKPQSLGVE